MVTGLEARQAAQRSRQIAEKRIREGRIALESSPVRLHHFPAWLRRQIRTAMRKGAIPKLSKYEYTGGDSLLYYAARETTGGSSWLDHWGSTKMWGEDVFVSEPYQLDLQSAERFAAALGLKWGYSATSWWYPGATFRIWFTLPEPVAPTSSGAATQQPLDGGTKA